MGSNRATSARNGGDAMSLLRLCRNMCLVVITAIGSALTDLYWSLRYIGRLQMVLLGIASLLLPVQPLPAQFYVASEGGVAGAV